MLVEDNEILAELLAEQLEADGHRVVIAHTAYHALSQARETTPELLICDFSLDGELDGAGLCAIIKSATASVHIVIVTGHLPNDVAAKCLPLDPLGILEKPVSYSSIVEIISRIERSCMPAR
jgi:CheY-like chemotaxis protein